MTAPYDHEALWVKAKLFINRAMDEDEFRSFDEQSLWAALALELLAKAALARVSPFLIAEPTEDGANLLIASGLLEGEARFISLRAKTLFSRCQKAFRPFNMTEASIITNARNEYLHGSAIGFTAIPQQAWWPRFWAQAAVLITALDKDIEDFVGFDRQDIVLRHLEQNAKNVEYRTETFIERAKQRLLQYRSGNLSARIAAEWKSGYDRRAGLLYSDDAICPACGDEGVLEGDSIIETETHWEQNSEFDADLIVTHTIGSDYFSCETCHLILDGFEYIEQAGLPEVFSAEGDPADYYEAEYGND